MNWDAMGAIAELIGGIAVLATLVYLAIQVKQNNFMQKQQTITTQTNRCIESGKIIATDPEFADLYMKAMKGKDLTGTELSRLSGFLFSVLTDFEEMYYTHKDGGQPEFRWYNLQLHVYNQIRPGTGGNVWWETSKRNFYTTEFIEFVDRLLLKGPAS